MVRSRRQATIAGGTLALALLVSGPLAAGPKTTVGRPVPAAARVSMNQVDHANWDRLLGQFVDARGDVDYAGWKRSSEHQQALSDYLQTLASADPRRPASREAALAFWINAYNALTIHGILREYPTTSIRNHTARLYGYNIWQDLLLTVGDGAYGLEQIEHDILRPSGESRIHFALVCASRSCPRLRREAYTADRLAEQLDENARDYFAEPGNFRYEPAERRFYLSPILRWFAEDFGATPAAQLQAIAPYLPTAAARQAAREPARISYLSYDWGLNDQATARAAQR